MAFWILVAILGGLLSILGFLHLARRFRRGEVRGRYLLAIIVGYTAFVAYAVLAALQPVAMSSAVTLLLLLPVFGAIVVLAHEHQKSKTV